jgi:hypothetical protein
VLARASSTAALHSSSPTTGITYAQTHLVKMVCVSLCMRVCVRVCVCVCARACVNIHYAVLSDKEQHNEYSTVKTYEPEPGHVAGAAVT